MDPSGRFIVKHKTEGKRLTRKLTALRQEAWRLMLAPMAKQREWFAAVLRGHYGYYGRPHNYPALNGFYAKCVGSGCAVCDGAARKAGAWGGRSSRP